MAEPTVRPAEITADQYRALMSAFPTGVAVVTARDAGGQPCGMTCSSLASVAVEPPMLLVCLRLGSRTELAVRARSEFAVNLLCSSARGTAELFARPFGDRFGLVRWAESPAGLPWLTADAFAAADCAVTDQLEVGDHAVLVGRVEHIEQSPDTPLLYGLHRFCAWNPTDPVPRPGGAGRLAAYPRKEAP